MALRSRTMVELHTFLTSLKRAFYFAVRRAPRPTNGSRPTRRQQRRVAIPKMVSSRKASSRAFRRRWVQTWGASLQGKRRLFCCGARVCWCIIPRKERRDNDAVMNFPPHTGSRYAAAKRDGARAARSGSKCTHHLLRKFPSATHPLLVAHQRHRSRFPLESAVAGASLDDRNIKETMA